MRDDTAPADTGRHFSAPRGAHSRGRLEFSRGAAHLAIRGASIEDLFRARFEEPVPSVTVDGGTVIVRYPGFDPRGWLRSRSRRGGEVTLNQDVAWHIQVRGGASHVRMRRPAGVPVRLHVGHGIADLRFDDQELGAVGGRLRLATPEATQASDCHDIEITSGAAHLEITAE